MTSTRHAPMARNSNAAQVGSTFAAFHLLHDGEGGWLDPEVEVGAIVRGSLSPNKAGARHAAEALARAGSPVAIIEIFHGRGRRLVAVVGDEAPPLGRFQ
jgi:hypothetical protein